MTVAELISLLKGLPQDLPVSIADLVHDDAPADGVKVEDGWYNWASGVSKPKRVVIR